MKRHDVDVLSLAFGVVFAVVVGGWLLLRWVSVSAPGAGWFLAVALVVLGGVGIVTTVRSSQRSDRTDREPGRVPPA